jgi:hypothetical protein
MTLDEKGFMNLLNDKVSNLSIEDLNNLSKTRSQKTAEILGDKDISPDNKVGAILTTTRVEVEFPMKMYNYLRFETQSCFEPISWRHKLF